MTEPAAPGQGAQPAAPAPGSRLQVATQVAITAALVWLYGGDLMDALRVPTAELAAFVQPPTAGFAGLALLLTLGAAGAAAYGHFKKLGPHYRGHRLLPIVLVVVLFADLVVVSSARTPISASERAVLAVHQFASRANALSTPTRVSTDEAELAKALADLGSPPYFVRGRRVPAFSLQVRPPCEGPVTERGDAGPGTLLYCARQDGKAAWVTLVGLPVGTRFGTPGIVTRGGVPLAGEVGVAAPEDGPDAAPGLPPGPPEEPAPGPRWGEVPADPPGGGGAVVDPPALGEDPAADGG